MVTFFYVIEGQHFDTIEAAQAELNTLLTEGYLCRIEKYALIDGEVYSAQEGEQELQFQSDLDIAEQRNRLIDFYG